MAACPAWDETRAADVMAPLLGLEGPLLPILHAMQATFGHIPPAAVPFIAARLNLTRAEVHGVVSFYHDFREAPAGRHVLKVCQAEACRSVGAAAQFDELLAELGLEGGGTTPDGRLTVEAIYCLGLCATAPAALLDGEPHGRLNAGRLAELAAAA